MNTGTSIIMKSQAEMDVTADITGAGWSTPILVTGGSVQLRLEARHKLSIPGWQRVGSGDHGHIDKRSQ